MPLVHASRSIFAGFLWLSWSPHVLRIAGRQLRRRGALHQSICLSSAAKDVARFPWKHCRRRRCRRLRRNFVEQVSSRCNVTDCWPKELFLVLKSGGDEDTSDLHFGWEGGGPPLGFIDSCFGHEFICFEEHGGVVCACVLGVL